MAVSIFSFPIVIFFMALLVLILGRRTIEDYVNWDFMDLPNWCAQKRRCPSCSDKDSEDMIPRFGGIPNQSQVWGLGESGGCGCSKFFH